MDRANGAVVAAHRISDGQRVGDSARIVKTPIRRQAVTSRPLGGLDRFVHLTHRPVRAKSEHRVQVDFHRHVGVVQRRND